jgi:hypothetical protein
MNAWRILLPPDLARETRRISAVRALPPAARSRLMPLFDVPVPGVNDAAGIQTYLGERADGIHQACGSAWPAYVDAHDLPPEPERRAWLQRDFAIPDS